MSYLSQLFADIPGLLLRIPIILIALTVHECAHGWVAYRCGDPTAKNLGRLSLNPLKHLDPFGTICLFLVGFGWARPVPINTRNFRNPKRGMALSALAGPVSNICLLYTSCCNLLWLLGHTGGRQDTVHIRAAQSPLPVIHRAAFPACYCVPSFYFSSSCAASISVSA